MRVALVQVDSGAAETVRRRRERVSELVRGASGADLVVLPELWAVGYFAFDRYEAEAEDQDGSTVSAARDWARALGAYVHVGSYVERTGGGRYSNAAALIAPDGTVVHRYRKVHVFGYESKEADLLEPGGSISATATPFGRMAATTCYDLRFPGLWSGLCDLGAEIVIVPAAWPAARAEHWRLLTTARAVESQVFVVACNAVGEQAGVALGGGSRVIDPWGTVIAEADTGEGITFCDVRPEAVSETRAAFPVLKDRLPDYRALFDPSAADELPEQTTRTRRNEK